MNTYMPMNSIVYIVNHIVNSIHTLHCILSNYMNMMHIHSIGYHSYMTFRGLNMLILRLQHGNKYIRTRHNRTYTNNMADIRRF